MPARFRDTRIPLRGHCAIGRGLPRRGLRDVCVVIDLRELGWDAARELEWAETSRGNDVPGRLVLEHNHIYRVLTAGGEVLAEAAGRLKHRAGGRHELPAVGDWVAIRIASPGHRSQIRGILRRRSVFSRKAAGRET